MGYITDYTITVHNADGTNIHHVKQALEEISGYDFTASMHNGDVKWIMNFGKTEDAGK